MMKNTAIWILKKVYDIDVNNLEIQNIKLAKENVSYLSTNEVLERENNAFSKTVDHLEEEKKDLQNVNAKLLDEINADKKKCVILQDTVNTLNYNITLEKESIKVLRSQIDNKIAEIEEKDNEIAKIQSRIQQFEIVDKDEDLNVDNEQVKDQIENLNRQYQNLKELYDQICKDNANYKAKINIKDGTIEILNKELIELHNENTSLKKRIASASITKEDESNKVAKAENIPDNPIPPETDSEKDNHLTEEVKETSKTIEVKLETITVVEPIQNIFIGSYIDDTKRTIDTVIDIETGSEINAGVFFSQPENLIFKARTELQKAIYLKKPKYVCKYCGQMVKISGQKLERGMAKFFSHLRDSDECDYKTTTGKTKKEINREKYSRCNEGERHEKLKAKIALLLKKTSGVLDVKTENTIMGNHPIIRWRRPDVLANFMGQEIAFELQLSTTFVSVITERDLFYRLNKKFIIWVFNFDEQNKHVNLNNMMTKDIYYNNKLNIFIFDKAAQEESEKRGELVLKCNWLKTDESWEYLNGNSSNELGGKFVTLSELTYDNTYKPYYFDAEKEYFAAHPEFQIKTLDIEDENKRIIEELDELWKKEKEALITEDKSQLLVESFELDAIIRATKKYIIGRKEDKYGLISLDGEIRIPFEYECINSRTGWYEGVKNGLYDLFDKNDYTPLNSEIRRIEDFNPIGAKYVKEVNGNLLWGIMAKRGVPLTSACYSKLDIWSSDKVIAVSDGMYCIIDFQGNEILSNYDYISELNSLNIANVIIDGRNGLIDDNCQHIKTEEKKLDNGLIKVCQIGRWGIQREDGTTIIPFKYDEIGSYKNGLIELSGVKFAIITKDFDGNCPVKVEYTARNDRKMLIFRVGKREAFMNLRQQQKAAKLGLQPNNMTEMYFSFVDPEKGLLYLSAVPTNSQNQQAKVKGNDIPLGSSYIGDVIDKNKNGFIIKTANGQTTFLHRSTLGKYTVDEFEMHKRVTIKKIGYDQTHDKDIWEIVSIQPDYQPATI